MDVALSESSLAQLGTEGRVMIVGLWLAPDRAAGVHAGIGLPKIGD
jgi:hypothetical protein